MATFIEIGLVPRLESSSADVIVAARMGAVFLRQLNRTRPLPAELQARYCLAQRAPGRVPWITVQLAVMVDSWNSADIAYDLAEKAQSVDHWDEQALLELRNVAPLPVTNDDDLLAIAA